MPTYDPEKRLTDNLAAFGYTHASAGHGTRDVVDATGVVVFTDRYEEVAVWLKGVDVHELGAAGWEVRFDRTDWLRPYARHEDAARPDRACILTPARWPVGGPGTPLRLSEWVHVADWPLDASR